MAYADYGYYLDFYIGFLITDEKMFRSFAERSSDYIDTVTFNRLKTQNTSEFTDKIKKCCCELAENLYKYSKPIMIAENSQQIKTSEKIGEYSVENANPYEYMEKYTSEQFAKIQKSTAMRYLSDTGLMYRGYD